MSNHRDINPNGIQVRDKIKLIHIHDVHAEVREGETGNVRGLSTVPKDSQNNELESNYMNRMGSQQKQSSIN